MGKQELKLDWMKFLNITAKIFTIFCLPIIALFFIAGGYDLDHLTIRDIALSICFPFGVGIGMIVAWFNEKIGALLTVISFFAFYLIHLGFSGTLPRGPYFFLFSFPGFIFLTHWIIEEKTNNNNR